ncbi:Mu-like prophage FluMu protein gp42: minor tail protein [Vibrio harveyi]|nr:Mu-like prophage FluMu protein gp42: minor tail protein [Vibrio harveyi]
MSKDLQTDIVLNLKGDLARKAKVYGKEMSTLGSRSKAAFTMISTSAVAASRGIDTLGNRMMFVAGTASLVFTKTFLKTAAEFERYQVMLNQLQGSEEGGAQAMSWIEQFTQDTPYAVNEVTQSFVKLKAFGLDPMDGTMQAIADQAAMMGGTAETVDGIATALGQAWTKGKLQGEEALQLLERGVPVWDYLNKASKELGHNNGLGYTTAQLQEMASQGKLTRDAIKDLIEQMGNASEGSAKKQMETWNGMISNVGDHWKIFQKDVMESGAFEELKKELGDFLAMLDEMKESGQYDEFVKTVGQDLVDGLRAAADAAKEIKNAGQEILPVVKQVSSMAGSMVEIVGGYGNLAKIMASIYVINKMLAVSGVLKGGIAAGGWVMDKLGKGKAAGGAGAAANALGATPVFVVNMPNGGMSGLDIDSPRSKSTKKSLLSAGNLAKVPLVGWASYELADIADDILGSSFDGYRDADAKFTTKIKAFFGDKDAQAQDIKYYGADPSKYEVKPMNPPAYMYGGFSPASGTTPNSYLATQAGEMKLKVEVSDERIKVTPTQVPNGITIDPDTGVN